MRVPLARPPLKTSSKAPASTVVLTAVPPASTNSTPPLLTVLPLAVPETVRSIRKGTGIDQCGAGADRVAAGELPVRAAVDGAVAEIDKIGADARQCVRGRAVRDE